MAADSDGRGGVSAGVTSLAGGGTCHSSALVTSLSDGVGVGGGDAVTTVVTCEGDLHDPGFHLRFRTLLRKLKRLLCEPRQRRKSKLRVNKVGTDFFNYLYFINIYQNLVFTITSIL